MRIYVILALLRKEAFRLLAQRGPLGMALLIVVTAILFSTLGTRSLGGGSLGDSGVRRCIVDHWREDPWLEHLRREIPSERDRRVEFRSLNDHSGLIQYPRSSVGIQLRPAEGGYRVWIWYPSTALGDGEESWCERWFWDESRRYFVEDARRRAEASEQALFDAESRDLVSVDIAALRAGSHDELRKRLARWASVPRLGVERSKLRGSAPITGPSAIAMGLVLLALFFVGVFLLPSITCEERERQTHHAIALTPASGTEILAAKLVFYAALATALGLLVAVISAPKAAASPLLWASVPVIAVGEVGIGLTIASLARTQRAASLGALLYLLSTSIVLFTFRGSALDPLAWLLLERHAPELLLAAFSGQVGRAHWAGLATTAVLALAWVMIASIAYRRSGWR